MFMLYPNVVCKKYSNHGQHAVPANIVCVYFWTQKLLPIACACPLDATPSFNV